MTTATKVKIPTLLCGYCHGGKHALCPGAVRVPTQPLPVVCRCGCTRKCLDCGERHDALSEKWVCVDRAGCEGTQAVRRATNPLFRQVLECKELGQRAREEANAGRAAVRRAAQERAETTTGDTTTTPDVPVVRSVATPDGKLFQPPVKRATREPRATSGSCRCCGEPTKGGNYLPGHDSRHVSTLAGRVKDGTLGREQALDQLPTPTLQAKLYKRLDAK